MTTVRLFSMCKKLLTVMEKSSWYSMSKSKGIALVEMIISMLLLSIVITASMLLFKEFHQKNHTTLNEEITKLELRNTKLFLEKNVSSINQLELTGNKLYFKGNLLLNSVSSFTIQSEENAATVSICIGEKVCQTMLIK